MNAAKDYYDSLINMGYSSEHAVYYTRQYFPHFSLVQISQLPHPVMPIQQPYYATQAAYPNTTTYVVQQYAQPLGRTNVKLWIGLSVGAVAIIVVIIILFANIGNSLGSSFATTPEFGFRADVDSAEYEDLGANRGIYYPGEDYPDFSATVYIQGSTADGDSWAGSGVVISDYWVLTAAHVVDEITVSSTVVWEGVDYEDYYGYEYTVKAIHIHPAWYDDSVIMESGVDIALLELDSPIDTSRTDIAAWATSNSFSQLATGELVYTSGYGSYDWLYSECSDYCLTDGDGDYSQRRAWANIADRYVGDIIPSNQLAASNNWNGGWIVYDFDSPDGSINSLETGTTSNWKQGDYSYAGSGDSGKYPLPLEGTSVSGDSGGPTFTYIGGEWMVIGITSHGSMQADYGDVAFNTLVPSHTQWICSNDSPSRPIIGCE